MADEAQKSIETYVKDNMQGELSKEMERAERLATLVMDSFHNNSGEELANV